ncbi:hypothetical protein EIJ81_00145 (plasmid) [Aliivibrio salmonicida]|uniref:hypothetical protein n=1 Tax=Aliivibrio salmonicida TaxID=40269 RepID=UPI000F7021DF|nr:hypothetical protein [Aliivibrio salmonicida]AZL83314.1 hypothetical protein EIJ81_00145 [Aliivibrio salmonicida]
MINQQIIDKTKLMLLPYSKLVLESETLPTQPIKIIIRSDYLEAETHLIVSEFTSEDLGIVVGRNVTYDESLTPTFDLIGIESEVDRTIHGLLLCENVVPVENIAIFVIATPFGLIKQKLSITHF